MKKENEALKGSLALFLLAGIYGFVGYFGRELAPGLSIWQQVYLRLILAAPLLWLTFRKRINISKCVALVRGEPFLIVLRALCLFVISVPLFLYATQNAKLGNVAFLQVLPYTFVLGVLINKERLTRSKLILMLLAFAGATLLSLQEGLNFSTIGRGELASIISGALFSLGFITRKKHKTSSNEYEISLTIMSVAVIIILFISLLSGDRLPHPEIVDTRFYILLLAAGYLNSGIILLANYGFRHVRDTLANNIMALEGVAGLIFGFFLYKEVPVSRELLGAAIILVAAIASTRLAKEQAVN